MRADRFALATVLAISFALLVDEIMLSAIFHVLLGAGNTVAAIAIALVGLSAGGIAAYSIESLRRPKDADRLTGQLLLAFAVTLMGSVFAIMAVPISHGDLIYFADDPAVQLWRLAVYHITVVPFFLGGVVISVVFRSAPERIGRLYFADLGGAAVGCVVSPMLLSTFGAPVAILVGGAPAALLVAWRLGRSGPALRVATLVPLALLALGVMRPEGLSFATINTMGRVEDPQYRRFAIEPGAIEYERWALDAWTIIRGEDMPQQWEDFRGWGLSPHYDGPIPETKLVNYNARFSTYVTDRSGDPEVLAAWLDADLSSLHHGIGRRYDRVLNIGAGGGREVLAALQHGASRVEAVDVSEVVVEDIMQGELREFSGDLYGDPRVTAVADEGRSYTERLRERFDLVEFSIVGGMNLEKMDLVRVDDLFTRRAAQRLGDQRVGIDTTIQAIFSAAEQVRFVKGVRRFASLEQAQHALAQARGRLHQASSHRPALQEQDAILSPVVFVHDIGPDRQRSRKRFLLQVKQQVRQRRLRECAGRDGLIGHAVVPEI